MLVKPEELPIIVEENLQSLKNYDFIIDAIIVDNPNSTALTILYEELSATNKYFFNVFSTKEAAQDWLINFIVPSF